MALTIPTNQEIEKAAECASYFRTGFEEGLMAAEGMVRRCLLFNSQRAVSWHEIQDCLKEIRHMSLVPKAAVQTHPDALPRPGEPAEPPK